MSESAKADRPEGWTWLINATKWHYFRDGRSLCGKWMHLGSSYEKGGDESQDNCAACRKKRLAEAAKELRPLFPDEDEQHPDYPYY